MYPGDFYFFIMNKAVIVLLMMLFSGTLFSFPEADQAHIHISGNPVLLSDSTQVKFSISAENILIKRFPKMTAEKRKRLISAFLAFPFPFGFMGAHRVMLGCKPWIPVVYVATFGGCFGLLPMIDFIAILTSKDISEFENNPHVFMWLK